MNGSKRLWSLLQNRWKIGKRKTQSMIVKISNENTISMGAAVHPLFSIMKRCAEMAYFCVVLLIEISVTFFGKYKSYDILCINNESIML